MNREIEAKSKLLERAAKTDHLTDLPNRLAVEEFASRQLRAAIRHKFNLWLIVTDLDEFKLVNDRHGHFAGDEAIQLHRFLMQIRGLVTFAEGWEEMNSCWS
jgi:two-component system, cell cycle response regulator